MFVPPTKYYIFLYSPSTSAMHRKTCKETVLHYCSHFQFYKQNVTSAIIIIWCKVWFSTFCYPHRLHSDLPHYLTVTWCVIPTTCSGILSTMYFLLKLLLLLYTLRRLWSKRIYLAIDPHSKCFLCLHVDQS